MCTNGQRWEREQFVPRSNGFYGECTGMIVWDQPRGMWNGQEDMQPAQGHVEEPGKCAGGYSELG